LAGIFLPLKVGSQPIGALNIFRMNADGEASFSSEEQALLISIADQVGAVVESARLRDQAELGAVLEERQRLARDLHDAVSQTLFSASVIAQTLDRLWERDPDLVRQNLVELEKLTRGALAEMRTLLFELRPATLEHTSMVELLGQLADGFIGRTQTAINVSIDGQKPLPFNVRETFFRLAQEALNNIIKHARATQVWLEYDSQDNQTQLHIKDDGLGFDPSGQPAGRHGLAIMQERSELIEAEISIISQPGKGTQIEIIWQA
jgi:signal transduction histidine kinase